MKPALAIAGARLRPTTATSLPALTRLLNDREVGRYLCDGLAMKQETVAAMLAESATLDARGLGLWTIEQAQGELAGLAGLQPVSAELAAAPATASAIEVLIALYPAFWGKGLATAALDALALYARDCLGLTRLVAGVDRPNGRSHRLLAGRGFKPVGSTPGPAHELLLYELRL